MTTKRKDFYKNPFPLTDPDRHQIWEMLVARDIIAFCNEDWSMVETDFVTEHFMGINGRGSQNPDTWRLAYDNIESYKKEWLTQARIFKKTMWAEDPEKGIYNVTTLRDIEINGSNALVHKKFDGYLKKQDGSSEFMNWQTLYRCKKIDNQWKIAGFTGYLPNPMGAKNEVRIGKMVPAGADQHKTAGPYSPVLEVSPGKIVVISGQASINQEGVVVGASIEEQTKFTLENCQRQLESAGCDLNDVFKVNVYLTDLDHWPRFNEIYKTFFKNPKPVRTAVQTPLLYTLLVEIEMWAVK